MKLFRPLLAVLAVASVFALVIADADARRSNVAGPVDDLASLIVCH